METLTGRLLVAVPRDVSEPEMSDLFDRSVVLLLNHDTDGAHGIVLNRPLPAAVDAVLPGWEDHVVPPGTLFQGGPVALDSALGLVSIPGTDESVGLKRLFRGVGLVDLDAPPVVVMPEVSALRIFAGYAGWEGGQLEGELRSGMWFVVDAEAGDAFTDDPDTLWAQVLRRQRNEMSFALTHPSDPNLN
ncbi:YqgE/AlgH family protein [Metallococcus carri]|uniref:YqgE/AlgH family protein n=1 Tax=Metallococcus carri TaxID=1656884 RepID=UPI002E283E3A|nr:YqgE/AlgH family protein [Metallococcus carri]